MSNIGELFREFNKSKELFDEEKTFQENLDYFKNKKLDIFKSLVGDETIIEEKLKIFIGQQFKKNLKAPEIKKVEIIDNMEDEVSSQDGQPTEENEIKLKEDVYLTITGTKRILKFPSYQIHY